MASPRSHALPPRRAGLCRGSPVPGAAAQQPREPGAQTPAQAQLPLGAPPGGAHTELAAPEAAARPGAGEGRSPWSPSWGGDRQGEGKGWS